MNLFLPLRKGSRAFPVSLSSPCPTRDTLSGSRIGSLSRRDSSDISHNRSDRSRLSNQSLGSNRSRISNFGVSSARERSASRECSLTRERSLTRGRSTSLDRASLSRDRTSLSRDRSRDWLTRNTNTFVGSSNRARTPSPAGTQNCCKHFFSFIITSCF